MKNILLILVGGTICTGLNEEGNLAVSDVSGALLKENFIKSDSPFADKVNIDLSENLYILSENMTVEKWNLIISTYQKYLQKSNYDGVIFAHGTDTLAYSAALFSILLAKTDIPVFFVSANENLNSPRSNGNDNFRCAVECICRGITPNVFVAYKNLSNGRMLLHLASRLCQCPNYSEDFNSVGAIDITDISQENYKAYFEKISLIYPKNKRKGFVDATKKITIKPCVLMLEPYVGIDYSAFEYKKYSAVLHGTYHSGTACAEDTVDEYNKNSVRFMIDSCARANVDAYFSPAILKKGTYQTVSTIAHHQALGQGIRFLYGLTREMTYAKLLVAYSLFTDKKEREAFMQAECNFEIIAKI